MIKALILDGWHEGHLVNLSEPMPTVRMAAMMAMRVADIAVEVSRADQTTSKVLEYKAVFRPLDGGNLWLYAEKKSDDVFFSQHRDWVTKDKWKRIAQRKDIVVEDNNPHQEHRQRRIEELKNLIKQNTVARPDFDLEGHLWALCHSAR